MKDPQLILELTSMEGGKGIAARLDASELCYAADGNNSKSKRILRDVTFSVGSGTFAALMGPSGAGKRFDSST